MLKINPHDGTYPPVKVGGYDILPFTIIITAGMDDDLFGGLPAVSTSNAGENASAIASVADAVDRRPKPVIVSATNDDEKKQVSTKNDDDEKQSSSSGKQQPSSKQTATSSSLVNSIGTAGTMMAFVPHAIRNKKRKSGSGSHTRTMAKQDLAGSQSSSSIAQLVVDSNVYNNGVIRKSPSEIIVHMKSDTPSVGGAENGNIPDDYNNNDCNNDNDDDDDDEPCLDNEPEAMRLLHASVTQPYDPYCPNDYLAYRERKKMEQIRKDMQASALQRLEQQEMLRKKIEDERKKLLESGDFSKIVEQSRGDREGVAVGGGTGNGRGRGVTNLPAWLVKKQDAQKKEMERSVGHINDGRFDDPAA